MEKKPRVNHIRPTVVCGREKAMTNSLLKSDEVLRLCKEKERNNAEQACKAYPLENKWEE